MASSFAGRLRGPTPTLLQALDAVARGTAALPLSRFSDTDVEWAIETGLGPFLHHVSKRHPVPGAAPRGDSSTRSDLTARVLTGVWVEAVAEILDAGPAGSGRSPC